MVDFAALAAPFAPEQVSWRVGTTNKKKRQRETGDNQAKATKGQALAYLDARDVMDRFDAVCGPAGWQNRYSHANGKTVCDIGVNCDGEWVWKADGAGDSDIEAEKGALSDAFKRAAVRWGVGRYLYDVDSPWVELDEWEKIKPSEMNKLRGLLSKGAPSLRLVERDPASDGDDEQPFARMAVAALQMATTRAALAEWFTKNEATINQQPDAAKAIIRAAYEQHLKKLRGAAA